MGDPRERREARPTSDSTASQKRPPLVPTLDLPKGGDSAAALLAYEKCREILADELGADPSPLPQKLHERILNGAKTKRGALCWAAGATWIPTPKWATKRPCMRPFRSV